MTGMNENPFGKAKPDIGRWSFGGWTRRPALVVGGCCLVVGLAVVLWRAQWRAADARNHARAEARAASAAVELEFSQAVAAAETLAAVARQNPGAVAPNFQQIANDLLATHSGLASLELQPGGVVSAILPRPGNERAAGFNTAKDPARRLAGLTAMRRRAAAVAGPLRLYGGEPGISVMAPVFQRGRDGREVFWGFAAASMRISEMLARAQVDELAARGYAYALLAPVPALQKNIVLAQAGRVALAGAVQQPIHSRNLEWRLAVAPNGGWLGKAKLALEAAAAFLLAGLLALVTELWNQRREIQARSEETTRRLASETAERKGAQEEFRFAKENAVAAEAELQQTRAALQKALADLAQVNARLGEAERSARADREAAEAETRRAEGRAGDLEIQLNAKIRAAHEAAQSHREELRREQAALEQARQTIAGLQRQLETAQARLEMVTRSAQESTGAAATKLKQAEDENRALRMRLSEAQQREAKTARLVGRIAEAEEELRRVDAELAAAAAPATPPASAVPAETTQAAEQTEADSSREAAAKRKSHRPGEPGHNDQMDLFPGPSPAASRAVAAEVDAPLAEPGRDQPGAMEAAAPAEFRLGDAEEETEEVVDEVHAGPREPELSEPESELEPASSARPKEHKRAAPHPHAPPIHLPELRKAVNQILPLLADQDPGAKDCLKDNRTTFRSAFAPEAYAEFEQSVKSGAFPAALEQLRKAVRKHGVSV